MLKVMDHIRADRCHGISRVANDHAPNESDEKEFVFWKTDELEAPHGELFDNILDKAIFINVFKRLMSRLELSGDETVLEMGGGQCWASAMIKREHPDCYVAASDLSPDAVRSAAKYESFLKVSIDEKWAFNCRQIPFADEQFDRVFTFAAFHHFGEEGDFDDALREMVRVVRPGGRVLLIYEPSSPEWTYKPALARARRNRVAYNDVDEDLLVPSRLRRECERLNCRFDVEYFASYAERTGVVEMVYYYALSKMKFLRKALPCSINVAIEKPS